MVAEAGVQALHDAESLGVVSSYDLKGFARW
jgi:hypothetical protein